jgi:hypothetical protein
MQIMQIVFLEIDETFSRTIIQKEIDSLQEIDLLAKY